MNSKGKKAFSIVLSFDAEGVRTWLSKYDNLIRPECRRR